MPSPFWLPFLSKPRLYIKEFFRIIPKFDRMQGCAESSSLRKKTEKIVKKAFILLIHSIIVEKREEKWNFRLRGFVVVTYLAFTTH
jgi:hypothetical protein